MSPTVDTEVIVAGLYEYLLAQFEAGTFLTTGRRVPHWSKVNEQPALFVRHPFDDDDWSGDGLQITKVRCEVWIYAKTESPDGTPDTTLNNLVRQVRLALEPTTDGNLTLQDDTNPGLVYRCRIEGRSIYDAGDADKQGKALIPVTLIFPT